MRLLDAQTVERLDSSVHTLLECAGQAIAEKLLQRVAPNMKIAVISGGKNNGGDGVVVARRLRLAGYDVTLFLAADNDRLSPATAQALCAFSRCGFQYTQALSPPASLLGYDAVVDCLLGTGLSGAPRPPYLHWIEAINRCTAPVYSVDLPSGVLSDRGAVVAAVRATETFVVEHPKLSAFLYPAADYYGRITPVSIGLLPPEQIGLTPRKLWGFKEFNQTHPRPQPNSYKGQNGKALIVGGSASMPFAPVLAGAACLKSGIGLLRLAVPTQSQTAAALLCPQATFGTVTQVGKVLAGFEYAADTQVIALGPGLDRTSYTQSMVEIALRAPLPLVLDADGLYGLALSPALLTLLAERTQISVLTPHTGEMALLCNCTPEQVEADRFALSREFASKYGVYLVLKGPFTLVTAPDGEQLINQSGHAALAKAGSGDLLTGILAAYLAKKRSTPLEAIANAVFAHGRAAEQVVAQGIACQAVTADQLLSALDWIEQGE